MKEADKTELHIFHSDISFTDKNDKWWTSNNSEERKLITFCFEAFVKNTDY